MYDFSKYTASISAYLFIFPYNASLMRTYSRHGKSRCDFYVLVTQMALFCNGIRFPSYLSATFKQPVTTAAIHCRL